MNQESASHPARRPVRSYVLRAGRLTSGQRRALDALWPRYGLAADGPLDLDAAFGRRAPRCLEIGFGMGDALLELAGAHPGRDYLGVEVHEPGVGRVLAQAEARGLANLRVLRADAVEVLRRCLAPASLDQVLVYFPDPWPKKRHHKRRLVQPAFAALVAERLRPGGRLELATDWEDYAAHMLAVLDAEPRLANTAGPGCFAARPETRPETKFERRGARLGHPIRDLVYERR